MNQNPRGITLLIAVILTSVVLSVALALLDLSYKQQILSSAAKNSQLAFYAADTAMECALYYDQKFNTFMYGSSLPTGLTCATVAFDSYPTASGITASQDATTRTTHFYIPCPSGPTNVAGNVIAEVTIKKTTTNTTDIYTSGYSSCNPSDPARIERGLKIHY